VEPFLRRFKQAFALSAAAPEDEQAFRDYCRDAFAPDGVLLAATGIACALLWWPLDWMVFANFPTAIAAIAHWRLGLIATLTAYLVLERWLPRRLLFGLAAAEACFTLGYTFGTLGGLDTPWFHFLYVWVLPALVPPLRLGARTVTAVFFGACLLAGFAVAAGGVWHSPFLPVSLSILTCVLLVTILGGQRIFALRRQAFFQQREIADLNARLDLQLRAKVVDRSRELGLALSAAWRPEPNEELPPRAVLRERFAVESRLGMGGMGVVYRARDLLVDRLVAIKVLRHITGVSAMQRFLREVEATAVVAHPAIVRSFHVDVTEAGRLFQVQELVDGEPLDRLLRVRGAMAPGHLARVGAALADALHAAHAHGVVHRDVKPSNVMLTRTAPGLRLLDFGISKLRGLASDTQTGAALGTPGYMAPEQAQSSGELGPPADVYALGATLSMLLTQSPVGRSFPSGTPPALGQLLSACLAQDPAARPTAAAVRDALADVAREAGALPLAEENAAVMGGDLGTPITQGG